MKYISSVFRPISCSPLETTDEESKKDAYERNIRNKSITKAKRQAFTTYQGSDMTKGDIPAMKSKEANHDLPSHSFIFCHSLRNIVPA